MKALLASETSRGMTVYTTQTCDALDDYLAMSHRALVMLRTVSRTIEARGDENQIEFDSKWLYAAIDTKLKPLLEADVFNPVGLTLRR
ncbi:hypothetical protein BDK61_2054 [Haloarcula quadrata]|uniref:Uncharacterized protein n=2 Tax=Haloarcula quadrata TaxID=182779 RepID=A0A495R675_9EURY|nr:hypothetical protein BDK61_2054 [Haloarcula quadrata]